MIHSLRWRIMTGCAVLTAVFLIAAGLMMMTLLKQSLLNQLDSHLLAAAQSLTTAFENHGQKPHFEWEGIGDGPPIIFCAWDQEGKILTQSHLAISIGDEQLPQSINGNHQMGETLLSNGKIGRSLLLSFTPHLEAQKEEEGEHDEDSPVEQSTSERNSQQARIWLQVAAPLSDIHNVITIATRQILIVTAGALVGAILLLWPITSMMIHPLSQLSTQIQELHPGELERRINIIDCPSELRPVVHRLNDFMIQLQDAFDRERTTTANISHELRTPLAGLKAILEVALSRPRTASEYQQTINQANEVLTQLEGLMERVLILARLDAGNISLIPEACDLASLLKETADELQVTQYLSWQLDSPITFHTDKISLSLIVRNLLLNAITYTTDPSAITVSVKQVSEMVTIEVKNPCAPIAVGNFMQLKQRFYQADINRTHVGKSAGLGLAISDELAELMNGTLELEQHNGNFMARLSLLNMALDHVSSKS